MTHEKATDLLHSFCTGIACIGAVAGLATITAGSMELLSNKDQFLTMWCAAFPLVVGVIGMLITGATEPMETEQ